MKKMIVAGLTLALLSGFVGQAFCQTATRKLGRGICNIVTCPVEILEQTKRVYDSDGPLAMATYGVVKGIFMTGARALAGVYETVTFLIPLPRNYKPILNDPEFFSEDMPWEYTM